MHGRGIAMRESMAIAAAVGRMVGFLLKRR
jgi:hypothetical protein